MSASECRSLSRSTNNAITIAAGTGSSRLSLRRRPVASGGFFLFGGGAFHRSRRRGMRQCFALLAQCAAPLARGFTEPLHRFPCQGRGIFADRPDLRGGPFEAIRDLFVLRLRDIDDVAGVVDL